MIPLLLADDEENSSSMTLQRVQYNLDYPNILVVRMEKSVRITEIVWITEIKFNL